MTTTNAISIQDLIRRERLVIDHTTKTNPGKPGRVVRVNPLHVLIDHSYQRNLNTRHATQIGQDFQFSNMKIPNGFQRADGTILITDGQHTCTGAALNGVQEIDVYVIDMDQGTSIQDQQAAESEQFLSINRSNKPVSKFDIYRNELIQGDPNAVALDAMCKRVGVTPCANVKSQKVKPGYLAHIHNLKTSWNNIGQSATEQALLFMRKYWPHEAIDGTVFIGISRFFQRIGSAQRSNLLVEPVNLSDLAMALKTDENFALAGIDKGLLEGLFAQTNSGSNYKADVWRSRAIAIAYNQYVGAERALPKVF